MKKLISTLLIIAFIFEITLTSAGCNAFYPPLNDEELQTNIALKNQLLLKLKDHSQLVLRQGEYTFIDKPSDLIFGIGRKFNYQTKKDSLFIGSFHFNEIDSATTLEKGLSVYHKYYLSDNSSIVFEGTKMFKVTPDSGSKYWITFNNLNELQKIKQDEIEEIQVLKTDVTSTIIAFIGIGVILGLIVLLIVGSQTDFSLGSGSL